MLKKCFSMLKKSARGFTLVEIIVVLVVLAILAAATIPSMLGFVNDAKQKALTSEVRAVYTAAQAYVTEHFAKGDLDENSLVGTIKSGHPLYYLLQNDATGKVSKISVVDGKVESFSYIKNDIKADYARGSAIKFGEKTNATLDAGETVNVKMKKLAGATGTVTRDTEDNNIQGFVKASAEQFSNSGIDTTDTDSNLDSIISEGTSVYPIFAWCVNHNIYYYTEADNVFLGNDVSYLFKNCRVLTDISGLESLDVSNATSLSDVFSGCIALNDIGVLRYWDVSNVTNMCNLFIDCNSLVDISSLSGWDTSKVTNVQGVFANCTLLSDLTALSNWSISGVTTVYGVFQNTAVSDAVCLESWSVPDGAERRMAFYNTPASANNKIPSWAR